jgi:hypothetical protein
MTLQVDKPGYYYEHTDGTIHFKPLIVVDMAGGPRAYFEGPFVKRWWKLEKGYEPDHK